VKSEFYGEPVDWMEAAACRDKPTEIFFSHRDDGDQSWPEGWSYDEARAICNDCPVRVDCLSYAMTHGIKSGMWGGKSPVERRRIRRLELKEIRRVREAS